MIIVLTCPRPAGVRYVDELIAAVDRAAPPDVRRAVVVDGPIGACVLNAAWDQRFTGTPIRDPPDNKFSGWEALKIAHAAEQDLLFLEDDVRPSFPDAIRAAHDYVVPDQTAYSSLFKSDYTRSGIWPCATFMMSQAIKIPRRSLDWLIRWRDVCPGDGDAICGFDTAIAAAGRAANWMYEQTEKNYFDHVGLVSAARPRTNGLCRVEEEHLK